MTSQPRASAAAGREAIPRLVAIGDLVLDVVVAPARAVERGTDVPGRLVFRRGGSAANTCSAFSHLGGRAALITSVGTGALGRRLVAALRTEGVTVHAVRVEAPTGCLAVLLDESGERSFITQRGAADGLTAADLRASWLRGCRALHVPAYSLFSESLAAASSRAVRLARATGALVSVDLSSREPLLALGREEVERRVLALAPDILFANRSEAAALLGSGTATELPRLLRIAPVVVIKDGLAGCRVLWWDRTDGAPVELEVAARRVAGSDSTGAGDAFAAGFLHAWLVGSGDGGGAALRRAAMAGHRAAAGLLRSVRPELHLG